MQMTKHSCITRDMLKKQLGYLIICQFISSAVVVHTIVGTVTAISSVLKC